MRKFLKIETLTVSVVHNTARYSSLEWDNSVENRWEDNFVGVGLHKDGQMLSEKYVDRPIDVQKRKGIVRRREKKMKNKITKFVKISRICI